MRSSVFFFLLTLPAAAFAQIPYSSDSATETLLYKHNELINDYSKPLKWDAKGFHTKEEVYSKYGADEMVPMPTKTLKSESRMPMLIPEEELKIPNAMDE